MRHHLPGLALLVSVMAPCAAQQTTQETGTVQTPSSLVQPALDSVARAGSAVDLNRWKGSNSLRQETDANLASMQKDLQATLPPLLAAADAAPTSATASLPVLLNLDALYAVLLRVAIASRGSAPRDEATALEQAATVLDSARRDLGDAVLTSARALEKQVTDLQATLKRQQTPQQPVTPAKPVQPSKARKRAAGTN